MDSSPTLNFDAAKKRHSKIFRFRRFFFPLRFFWERTRRLLRARPTFIAPDSVPEFQRLPDHFFLKRITRLALFTFLVFSFMPAGFLSADTGFSTDYAQYEVIATSEYLPEDGGYLLKGVLPTETGQRLGMQDKIMHIVESGENVSMIAAKYGLKTSTVLWENSLSEWSQLRIGQKLVIPPIDGVTHNVVKGDTLEKVAKKYEIDLSLIAAQNHLDTGVQLSAGDSIFIPNGKKASLPAPRALANAGGGTIARVNYVPRRGKVLIFPTTGSLTQGFRSGHYALDIANVSRPSIWAAASGKVITAQTGWSGGYGNHIVIDHGNGMQTLYAHMAALYVQSGDVVSQGQIIGQMGRTGRVYGATGIHLHFEVREDGRKVNPVYYY